MSDTSPDRALHQDEDDEDDQARVDTPEMPAGPRTASQALGDRQRLREALAALAHEQWAGWMRHLFARCSWNDDRGMLISREWADRWHRQVETPYASLSEAEQESDRKEADRVLAVLGPAAALHAQIATLQEAASERDAIATLVSDRSEAGTYAKVEAALATLQQDRAAARVALPPPLEPKEQRWLVARKRDIEPWEVNAFDRYDDAAMFFDAAQQQWSTVYFCRVAHCEGRPLDVTPVIIGFREQLAATAAALTSLQLDACCVACAEGNHQQCLGGRCACIHDSRMPNAEAALADQRQLVARLREYVQHDDNCMERYRPVGVVVQNPRSYDCTCGLAALVAELSQEAQEDDQSRVD